jgi:hypothetical protein
MRIVCKIFAADTAARNASLRAAKSVPRIDNAALLAAVAEKIGDNSEPKNPEKMTGTDINAPSENPEDAPVRKRTGTHIRRCITELSGKHQEIIEEKTLDEIARQQLARMGPDKRPAPPQCRGQPDMQHACAAPG